MDSNANIKRLKHSTKRNRVQLSHRSELLLLPWNENHTQGGGKNTVNGAGWKITGNPALQGLWGRSQVPPAVMMWGSPSRFLTGHSWMVLPICISTTQYRDWTGVQQCIERFIGDPGFGLTSPSILNILMSRCGRVDELPRRSLCWGPEGRGGIF